ncbi:MAG: NAD(+)/NADH kinase [Oscillospiraceae bacterium]|nr:NAD(+)/NADH kinase [Oscillospiraceae bacterium]
MKVLLCLNVLRDTDLTVTKQVDAMLTEYGAKTVLCPLSDGDENELHNITLQASDADMVVTFGGDGTILKTARAVAEYEVPIIAVNMGDMGFMAELEPNEIDGIRRVMDGDYKIVSRIMLDVSLSRDGETIFEDFALNDIVIKGINKVITLELFGDDNAISSFTGDGAVIATPTGSTAYSMSAGGPIVEPDASNIIITPICPHVLTAKSFVLAPERVVRVVLGGRKVNTTVMTVDGQDITSFKEGDELVVKVSKRQARFISLSNRSFYKKVYEKLGERK